MAKTENKTQKSVKCCRTENVFVFIFGGDYDAP